jgi:hypothetical protein
VCGYLQGRRKKIGEKDEMKKRISSTYMEKKEKLVIVLVLYGEVF